MNVPDLAQLIADATARAQRKLVGKLHPHTRVKRLFADDSFADEVDTFIATQRQREREEAAQDENTRS